MFKKKQKFTSDQLRKMVKGNKSCQGCIFNKEGNCFFAYNCLVEKKKFTTV